MTSPQVEFLTIRPVGETDTHIPCAIRIIAPSDVDRLPTHFILLLDVSESMLDNKKLENCKQCAILLLNFMTEADRISLITFGNTASIHLKCVPADETHKQTIKQRIESLQCDGCTNLSAGLGYVRQVCEETTLKTGLLLLTDGHANRGVSGPSDLRNIVSNLRQTFTSLSIHAVAYGTDHNADLLRAFAEDNQGSYNVVNTIEDTAFAFGETLGGLTSCAYQNVKLQVPAESRIHGPHKLIQEDEKFIVSLGDIYAGTKPLLLLDIPRAEASSATPIRVVGMTLPTLASWSIQPIQETLGDRDTDIELTSLRYECTSILNDIRNSQNPSSSDFTTLEERITTFASKLASEFFNGHPITTLLRSEVHTLRGMLETARHGPLRHEDATFAAQHLTSIALGRGFSSPMASGARINRSNPRHIRRQNAQNITLSSPSHTPTTSPPPEPTDPTSIPVDEDSSTAFLNATQQRIAALMRTSSQHPYTH